jgi:3-keto-disaccharide hydrolase
MRKLIFGALFLCAFVACALPRPQASQFVGRWDFNLAPGPLHAAWLGITENGGALEVWYQPTGGNVYKLKDPKVNGSKLLLTISGADTAKNRPAVTWELEAAGGKLTGVQKRGDRSAPITGVPAPELKRSEPAAWSAPEPLLNGRNLDGWEPIGNPANSHWTVKDGMLVNEEHGANLKTTRTFDDFKVHFEVNCPDDANSGFYLRGRYEVQLEYEPLSSNPPERRIGSIYGRITPKNMPRRPGTWETFDVTLVGRTVTVVRDGVTTIDHKEIEGITGGALDANEGEPGPFYIQGDHTGGLKFRNIRVSVPAK